MDDVQIVFIVGAGIFGVGAVVTGMLFAFFVAKNYDRANGIVNVVSTTTATPPARKTIAPPNPASAHSVHWLNSIWIYMVLFTVFLLFTALYGVQAAYSGLYVATPWRIIAWLRWFVLALIGVFYMAILAFFLTDDSGDSTWNRHPRPAMRAQSFFIVFYYAAAILAIAFATIIATQNGKIVLMVWSMVAFVISLVLFVVPYNKCVVHDPEHPHDYTFFTGNDGRTSGHSHAHHVDAEERRSVITAYRAVFLLFLSFAYIFNVIIWFTARSNAIWTDGLSFRNESILYLISDGVFIVFFSLLLMGLTFYYGMKTVAWQDAATGRMQYAAPAPLAASVPIGKFPQPSFSMSSNVQVYSNAAAIAAANAARRRIPGPPAQTQQQQQQQQQRK